MSGSTNQNASSLVWKNYVDIFDDVYPWLQKKIEGPTPDVRLQLLTDMTCQWAQKKIGQPVAPTKFYRRKDGYTGWNGTYIQLDYYPILEVESVIEWWGSSGPHDLPESTPSNQVDGFQCNYETGQLIRSFMGNVQKPWFPGSRNIEVTWTAGYNPIPADIKVATLEMIAHWWRNTQQGSSNRTYGGPSTDYDPDVVASGLWQGTPLRILGLLEGYLEVSIG